LEAVIALAHGFRISVVAEGIETEAQLEQLRAMGCDVGQGYLFARPLVAAEAGRLLSGRRATQATRAGVVVGRVRGASRPKRAGSIVRPKAVA
jgi:sensor c-di-GMP phosphodiesterase-like protein